MTLCPWPDCGRPQEGIGTFCWSCSRYASDFRAEAPDAAPVNREDPRSEREIQNASRNAWRALGFDVWGLSQTRATHQAEGLADDFVTGRGLCIWVEYKTATGVQRESQQRFQAAVEANGGRYLLVRHESEVIAWHEQIALWLTA